ncbi:uncharacterized protein LOC131676501 [Topomyia yanbarensis]|uniref:uncharacterized protein LOC131676501 n=1 Tax=Topomyia yanbarensis TaxID=2498891 RepID=UPI00273C79FC|nr:uncharacterized protein LOC131676501 [Topomyia yanbarensis]
MTSKKTLEQVIVVCVIAVLCGDVVRCDLLRKSRAVISAEVTTESMSSFDQETTTVSAKRLQTVPKESTIAVPTTTEENESDSVGISTVIVQLKHFGTKNFTFLEPDHIPISNFLDLDENVDLELLFTEHVNASLEHSNNPAENVVLQIEDYDDDGNTKSYFLHSSPYSANPVNESTPTSKSISTRVSGFFRDVLQRLGVYKYIVNYRNRHGAERALDGKIPHRFHPNSLSASVETDQVTTSTPSASTGSSTSKRPTAKGHPAKSSIASLFDQFKQRIKAIYPGTVWCGDGNQAKSENDIGFFYQTDVCCRAHDLCPMTIAAGDQFDRLRNNGFFTRSHCDCDKQFYNCLKNANTLVSSQIGYTYFNLLKPQCFRHEHPKVACSKKSKHKCLTYVVDETKDKLWQWFDNLIF